MSKLLVGTAEEVASWPLIRSRCICGKARYATEREAARAAKRMRRTGRDRRKRGEWLIPYQCVERKGIWHVGHAEE